MSTTFSDSDLLPVGEISQQENVVIGSAGNRDLIGTLYIPPRIQESRPAMVIVHGGGWRKGSTRGVSGFGEFLSRAGFVCLCPSYRLSGEAHWPAQIEDVKCAIRYLKVNKKQFGLDKDRVGITGDSAGGHLALMAAVHSDFEGSGGHIAASSNVKAVGAMYGPVRVRKTRADGSPLGLLDPTATDTEYASASPIHYDLTEFPPCLLIHGADDPAVPLSGTLEFYTKLVELGRTVELHSFAGEGHAFDRRSSTQERMVDILDPSSISGPTVIRLLTRFFKKYL
ncbi:MAG: alpha/beta hydrolase [Gammaproteobacteria bacterium]|nr:alpha/beta hydrolase [Gammaproteobacteria bacterium]